MYIYKSIDHDTPYSSVLHLFYVAIWIHLHLQNVFAYTLAILSNKHTNINTLKHTHKYQRIKTQTCKRFLPPPPPILPTPLPTPLPQNLPHLDTHTHTKSLSFSLFRSPTITHTIFPTFLHTQTHTHSFSLSLSHTRTLSLPLANTHTHTHTQACWVEPLANILSRARAHTHTHTHRRARYGVATASRLHQIIGLFCRISSLLWGSFAKETYNFKEPTSRSHCIWGGYD